MDLREIGRVLGLQSCAMGLGMLPALLVSLAEREPAARAFGVVAAATLLVGAALALALPRRRALRLREVLTVLALGTALAVAVGALPLWLSDAVSGVTDACFEAVAGWSTTAATVLAVPEHAPRGILMWRATMQWMGGLAFLVLATTTLPLLGLGIVPLLGGFGQGRGADRLTPRVVETAKLFWGVYVLLTLVQVLALVVCGAGAFEAVCHALATVSTGGFSTRAGSVAAFQSPALEGVIVVFMLAAGANFTLHSLVLAGHWRAVARDGELRAYLILAGATAGVLALSALLAGAFEPGRTLRGAVFAAAATVSTTGFSGQSLAAPAGVTALLLMIAMLVGGCAGSTAGGLKVIRALLLLRHAGNELRRLLHPQAVFALRHNGAAVAPGVLGTALALVWFTAATLVMGALGLALLGLSPFQALALAAGALSNTGGVLAGVDPAAGYAALPSGGKWILIFCMLLGRLELVTLLALCTPDFWRRA